MLQRLERLAQKKELQDIWPDGHIVGTDGLPVEFHIAQKLAYETKRRTIGLIGGSQLGKQLSLPGGSEEKSDCEGAETTLL